MLRVLRTRTPHRLHRPAVLGHLNMKRHIWDRTWGKNPLVIGYIAMEHGSINHIYIYIYQTDDLPINNCDSHAVGKLAETR